MMKQRWGLDRNVLRPTPGDPWGVEQHHWNTGAEENQQLNPGGPSNRQKSSGPNQVWRFQQAYPVYLHQKCTTKYSNQGKLTTNDDEQLIFKQGN